VVVAKSVYCPGIFVDVLSRTGKSSEIASVAVEMRTKQLADTRPSSVRECSFNDLTETNTTPKPCINAEFRRGYLKFGITGEYEHFSEENVWTPKRGRNSRLEADA
jgi:hypothetical protein